MEIIIAGNSSFAYYSLVKLCRKGFPVAKVIVPDKNAYRSVDSVDFSGLVGEFDLELIKITGSDRDDKVIETDVLINLEWPDTLKLPVKSRIARIGSNLAGQFSDGFLVDIAAEMYNGNTMAEVQLILEQDLTDYEGTKKFAFEPPYFTVLGDTKIEINPFDDIEIGQNQSCRRLLPLIGGFFKQTCQNRKYPAAT